MKGLTARLRPRVAAQSAREQGSPGVQVLRGDQVLLCRDRLGREQPRLLLKQVGRVPLQQ